MDESARVGPTTASSGQGFALQLVRNTVSPHGRSAAAVVTDVSVYEGMLDEIAILRDIRIAEEQIARGEGIPHEEVVARLRSRLHSRSGKRIV